MNTFKITIFALKIQMALPWKLKFVWNIKLQQNLGKQLYRGFQSVVLKSGPKMAKRVFHFLNVHRTYVCGHILKQRVISRYSKLLIESLFEKSR